MPAQYQFVGNHEAPGHDVWTGSRVEHFAIFEKLVFVITFKNLKFLMEHIEPKGSSDSKLQIESICYVGIRRSKNAQP